MDAGEHAERGGMAGLGAPQLMREIDRGVAIAGLFGAIEADREVVLGRRRGLRNRGGRGRARARRGFEQAGAIARTRARGGVLVHARRVGESPVAS